MTSKLPLKPSNSTEPVLTQVYRPAQPLRDAGRAINHRQRYATLDELDWLRDHAATLPAHALAIVLGAGPGVMLAALKDGNPTLDIFVVDIDTCEYALAHLREYGPEYVADVFTFIGDSGAVGTRYEGRQADLLIVDADHTEQGVFRDLVSWLGHVKAGGMIMCHDYDATGTWFEQQEQYQGVKAACERVMRSYNRPQPWRVGTSALFLNEMYSG